MMNATKVRQLAILIISVLIFTSCATGKLPNSAEMKGLYKVTILYPDGEGKTFDMTYYENKHMPMVAGYIGNNLAFYEIDKGVMGRTSADQPTYVAIGYFYVRDIEAYNKAILLNREAVIGDIRNYTNIQPVIQISELVKVGQITEER